MKREEVGYVYPKDISVHLPVFNCPWHGAESQVFCFRAFDEQYLDRWSTYKIVLDGEVSKEDVRAYLDYINPEGLEQKQPHGSLVYRGEGNDA